MSTIGYDIEETLRTHAASPLYAFNSERGLTFAEIVMAVSVERAMRMEAISVSKMSTMTKKTTQLSGYTACAKALNDQIAKGSYPGLHTLTFALPDGFVSAREGYTYPDPNHVPVSYFLLFELGVSLLDVDAERGLTDNKIATTSNNLKLVDYLTAYGLLKQKMDKLNTNSQEDMIDVQTYVSRRDVAYNLATNAVKTIMKNAKAVTDNF